MSSPADHFERGWTLACRLLVAILVLILAAVAGLLCLILA